MNGADEHNLIAEEQDLRHAVGSRFSRHCEGYFAGGSPRYLLGIALKLGVVEYTLPCPGSMLLDEINAFDTAEVAGSNLGQINVVTVSSFCGPQGQVWGYDLCAPASGHASLGTVSYGDQRARLFDLTGLTMAFDRLVGTIDELRFPFMPGSHVPVAMKVKTSRDPGVLYAALALGIPEDRRRDACLLMENPGHCLDISSWDAQREAILHATARSVLAVGENQRVRYHEVFVGVASIVLRPGQVGCAVAMAPYFRLAGDAFVENENLMRCNLETWEEATAGRFLRRGG